MLYVTTRNKIDSFTAYKVLRDGFAADGGQFLPILMPQYTHQQIQQMLELPFCDVVADVLNAFFNAKLMGRDVEFAVGKRPVRFAAIGRKIMIAEFWHNTDHSLDCAMDRIYRRLCMQDLQCSTPKGWALIAIRIALLFGVFAQLHQEQISVEDVAITGPDLDAMMAAWYARAMGLPIGLIVCGINENRGFWDLLNKGQMDVSAAVVHTNTPLLDQSMPSGVERLIYETLGREETLVYLHQAENKGIYRVPQENREQLGQGIVCSVIGENRVMDLVNSVYHTNHYFIDPYMAISFGALQDHRSKTGENRMTLIFSDSAPSQYAKLISSATGVPGEDIKNN